MRLPRGGGRRKGEEARLHQELHGWTRASPGRKDNGGQQAKGEEARLHQELHRMDSCVSWKEQRPR